MNLKLYVLSLFLLNFTALPAQQNNTIDRFAKANELYESGDVDGAYILYKIIGNKTAPAWYNMGNAAYKKTNYPQAIACWYRAMREGGPPFMDDCLYNINSAYTKMGIENQQSWHEILLQKTGYQSLLFFQILFLLLFYLIGAAFILLKGNYRTVCMSFLLLFISAETVGLVAARSFWNDDTCIIGAAKAPLHVGPDNRFLVTNQIEKASRAQVIDQRSGWYKVKSGDQCGWISAEYIELV